MVLHLASGVGLCSRPRRTSTSTTVRRLIHPPTTLLLVITSISSTSTASLLCYMHIPLKDRTSKLPARRAHRCRFLAYSYTTILVPTYVVIIVHDNNTYGRTRVSRDIIFDESCVFDKCIDNSPTDEDFAGLHLPIEDITSRVLAPNEPVSFMDTPPIEDLAHAEQAPPIIPHNPPPLELHEPGENLDLIADLPS